MNAVFFDLDGTLTDPKAGIVRSIRYALDRLGVDAPGDDELTRCIGPPLLDSLGQIVGMELASKALELYRERFSEVGWQENCVYPGVIDALEGLKETNRRLYVATSKPSVFARRIVEHFNLDGYFLEVFGSELDGTRSHKAELLRFALNETSTKERAVMIGDREHDILGAKENQMKSIGVTYGYGSLLELTSAGADLIVRSPDELLAVLG